MRTNNFTDQNLPTMQGQTVLITGGNTGLGFEVAKALSSHQAHVIIACRSVEKADAALKSILGEYPHAELSSVELNLSSIDCVAETADALSDHKLDILINNAGIMIPPYELTQDGFESQFGVNHLGPFALTGLLLNSNILNDSARIVNTSSLASINGKIFFDDINAEQGYKAMDRYAMSKLANLLYSNELDRRLKAADSKITSVACHPGIATTDLSRNIPRPFMLLEPLISLAFNTPKQGAWSALLAACDPSAKGGRILRPLKVSSNFRACQKVAYAACR